MARRLGELTLCVIYKWIKSISTRERFVLVIFPVVFTVCKPISAMNLPGSVHLPLDMWCGEQLDTPAWRHFVFHCVNSSASCQAPIRDESNCLQVLFLDKKKNANILDQKMKIRIKVLKGMECQVDVRKPPQPPPPPNSKAVHHDPSHSFSTHTHRSPKPPPSWS